MVLVPVILFFLIFNFNLIYYLITVHMDLFSYLMAIILYSLFDILFVIFAFGTPTRNYFNIHWRKRLKIV
jgi:hypothetical protein